MLIYITTVNVICILILFYYELMNDFKRFNVIIFHQNVTSIDIYTNFNFYLVVKNVFLNLKWFKWLILQSQGCIKPFNILVKCTIYIMCQDCFLWPTDKHFHTLVETQIGLLNNLRPELYPFVTEFN